MTINMTESVLKNEIFGLRSFVQVAIALFGHAIES
ncbi:hypothetical protein AFCDBAGC_1702 [Methylobacterium cerastii]|uniref:Uncharacterized protein n=1 Tax=Methylobacterium cerastii TaxID=932741 RepID=A0ABQ4QF68_9HYPH|nr:hypothetical protein AFCDBAGC_1702 [Methylobacterium cerastii]